MALSGKARKFMTVALCDKDAAKEVCDAIDTGILSREAPEGDVLTAEEPVEAQEVVTPETTFDGGVGGSAYTIQQIAKACKDAGILEP